MSKTFQLHHLTIVASRVVVRCQRQRLAYIKIKDCIGLGCCRVHLNSRITFNHLNKSLGSTQIDNKTNVLVAFLITTTGLYRPIGSYIGNAVNFPLGFSIYLVIQKTLDHGPMTKKSCRPKRTLNFYSWFSVGVTKILTFLIFCVIKTHRATNLSLKFYWVMEYLLLAQENVI